MCLEKCHDKMHLTNAFNIVVSSNQAQVLCVNEAKSGEKKHLIGNSSHDKTFITGAKFYHPFASHERK